jgi:pimeloyl-ACP methyl ester carboxylesterase
MSRAFLSLQCGPRALADRSFREYVLGMYGSDGEWRVFCNVDYGSFADLDGFPKPPGFPPTLVLWGSNNRMLRASAGRELAAALEAERDECWDDCGYMIMREQPSDTNRILEEFIGRHAASRDARQPQGGPPRLGAGGRDRSASLPIAGRVTP